MNGSRMRDMKRVMNWELGNRPEQSFNKGVHPYNGDDC